MSNGNILVIDDEEVIVDYLTELLEESGYSVFQACEGQKGLSILSEEKIDLVLLDVRMPAPNGFDVCRQIKANPGLRDIPVIFLSGQTDFNQRMEGFQLGAVDYIIKPVHISELRARVGAHIRLYQLRQNLSEKNLLLEEQIHEKEQAEKALKEVLETLENRVAERTQDLQEANTRLQAEVAERERMQILLQESEARYRMLFHHAADSIFLHRITPSGPGQFIEVNDSACIRLGYSREQMLSLSPADIHKLDDDQMSEIAGKLLREKSAVFHVDLITKDGQVIPHEMSSHLFSLGADQVVLSVARDISQRLKIEEALRTSEMRFQAFMRAAPLFVFYKDAYGRYQYCNQLYESLFGFTPGEWLNKTDHDLFDLEKAQKNRAGDLEAMETGKTLIINTQFQQNEAILYGEAYKFPFQDASGNRFVGSIAMDNTRRYLAEAELKKRRDEAELLFEAGQRFSSQMEIQQILTEFHYYFKQIKSYENVLVFQLQPDETLACIFSASDNETCRITDEEAARFRLMDLPTHARVAKDPEGEPHVMTAARAEIDPLVLGKESYASDPHTHMDTSGMVTSLFLPLRIREQTKWIVQILFPGNGEISPDELRVFETLGNQAAIAINNAQLYQMAQEEIKNRKTTEAKLRAWNAELAILNQIATIINQSQDQQIMLHTVLAEMMGLADADSGWVFLLDQPDDLIFTGDREKFDCLEISNMDGETRKNVLLGMVSGKELIVIQKGSMQYEVGLQQGLYCERVNSFILIPIYSRGNLSGLIGLHLFAHKALDSHWRDTLNNIGSLLGTALENLKLVRNNAEMSVYQELEEIRSELIANVSHEMRTPIGLIKATSTALLLEDIDISRSLQAELLQDISEECDKLEEIVSSLLMVSRIQSQSIFLDIREMDLAALVRQEIGDIRSQYLENPFQYNLDEGSLVIQGDALHLRQVIRNLLSNAAKYSGPGKTIRVEMGRTEDQVHLKVIDEGIGIPADEQEKIFQRFYRVKNDVTQRVGGIGLGLSLCKGIVEMHAGRIWVESNEGQGSLFNVLLPCQYAQQFD